MRLHSDHKHERRSFSTTDYMRLLDAAHRQLKAPTEVNWGNLKAHLSADMRQLVAARIDHLGKIGCPCVSVRVWKA